MKAIEYAAPATLDEALGLLARWGPRARVLAGGTDLIVQMREGKREPDLVVDVKAIPELDELSFDPSRGLVIGAAVPCSRIAEDPRVLEGYPALADAAGLIGSIQIQNRASLGGNLCNASPAADGVPPLIVLKAICRVAGPRGDRRVAAEDLCTAPGQTALGPDEVLVALELPAPAPRSGSRYLRFIPRGEMDIAVAGAAAWLALGEDLDTIRDARVALAAVAPTPLLVPEAARALIGRRAGREAFDAAAGVARAAARPISDMRGEAWQRTHLAGVLTRRALEGALELARAAN